MSRLFWSVTVAPAGIKPSTPQSTTLRLKVGTRPAGLDASWPGSGKRKVASSSRRTGSLPPNSRKSQVFTVIFEFTIPGTPKAKPPPLRSNGADGSPPAKNFGSPVANGTSAPNAPAKLNFTRWLAFTGAALFAKMSAARSSVPPLRKTRVFVSSLVRRKLFTSQTSQNPASRPSSAVSAGGTSSRANKPALPPVSIANCGRSVPNAKPRLPSKITRSSLRRSSLAAPLKEAVKLSGLPGALAS